MNKDKSTVNKKTIDTWWNNMLLGREKKTLAVYYWGNTEPNSLTDEQVGFIYKREHLDSPKPEAQRTGGNIPENVKREMINDAKAYASYSEGTVTINNPDKYGSFRDGQQSGYQIAIDKIIANHDALVEALRKIEQMSDCGNFQSAVINMKQLATKALNNIK